MKKIKYENIFIAFMLIFSSWLNYYSNRDGCLMSGGGAGICGNLAIIFLFLLSLGSLYVIYISFKK